jgi:hypothetical protein
MVSAACSMPRARSKRLSNSQRNNGGAGRECAGAAFVWSPYRARSLCSIRPPPARRAREDCYSTPAVAIDALLTVESLPYRIWEPAAGYGNIVSALRDAGHKVIASDVIHYTFSLDFEADFLAEKQAPAGTELKRIPIILKHSLHA